MKAKSKTITGFKCLNKTEWCMANPHTKETWKLSIPNQVWRLLIIKSLFEILVHFKIRPMIMIQISKSMTHSLEFLDIESEIWTIFY